jgi:hypothetical protein
MRHTLLDTGPLVAYLGPRDACHQWADRQFAALRPPLLTCEPVLAEAYFLVERNSGCPGNILKRLADWRWSRSEKTGVRSPAIPVTGRAGPQAIGCSS